MGVPFRQYWKLLGKYFRPQWQRIALLGALLLVSNALLLVNPQILRSFIDTAMGDGAAERLISLALIFIALALLVQLLLVAATYVGAYISWTATNALRLDLAAHCLQLDMAFHKEHSPGEMIERIDGDVSTLSNFFSQLVLEVINNLLLMTGVLALLFSLDWRVGLPMTVFAAMVLVLLTYLQLKTVPFWHALRDMSSSFFGWLGEHLAGTADLRANGATGHVMRRFAQQLQRWAPIQRRAKLGGYSMWIAGVLTFALGQALAFGLGLHLWGRALISLGTVYIIFHYTELLQGPILKIREQLEDLQEASASIERINALLALQSRIVDGPGETPPGDRLALEMRDVSFSYEADQQLLRNISFRVEPGETLGLLGRTGSGKTSLVRLIMRLYDPLSGTVELGGVPLQRQRLRELRRRVGMVSQDVQLFHASLRDNLTLFKPGLPDEQISGLLEELGLGPWLRSLPAGLDTMIEGSSELSAGQAQLLGCTRLFLLDPSVVILDEASSRLDPVTDRLVDQAIRKLLEGRTSIIIAHRLSTVERVDKIMILQDGEIVEYGPRRALAENPNSRLAGLLRAGMSEVLA
jgi:ATP-binding cassette subfamily B protein